jgi:energy-converting hydrogenase A subunit J
VLVIIYLKTGSMAISDIISYQAVNGPLLYAIPFAAAMYLVLIISKAQYTPFSITKGKDIVSGYETEHFGLLRGYLMISESIMWYMLLWIFLTVFLGPISPLLYIIGMVGITVGIAFISATSPLLNPNHSVVLQIMFAIIGIVGSILLFNVL